MGERQSAVESIEPIRAWLLGSGIQDLSANPKTRGGFSAWYELDSRIYPFLYSEITGYALSALVYLSSRSPKPDPLLIKRAEMAADWLKSCARLERGGIRTRYYLVKDYETPNYSFHQGRVYTFDTAIVGYGLLQLYKATQKRKYLEWAWEIADFISVRMAGKDGLFYPYYESATRKPGEDLDKWSDQAGSFHGKLALFFIDLWRLTADPRIKRQTHALLKGCLRFQRSDGRFVTSRRDDSTHLHPHCYTMEGLAYAYLHFGTAEYARSLKKGTRWLLGAIGDDGSVSTLYSNGRYDFHERSDIVAQVLRMGAVVYGLGVLRSAALKERLLRVRKHLELFVYRQDNGQKGGVLYGSATDGLVRMHLNAWCAMFTIQAVLMHEDFVQKGREAALDAFV